MSDKSAFERQEAMECPIGVFDSGVGGLSVLRQLLRQLPQENMVYLADSAWAPYGERSSEQIAMRSLQIMRYLHEQHRVKALVVACNTATSQAVQQLRAAWPHLPMVGIEPAIKPAVALSRTGQVGIMATRATVQSAKFSQLVKDWSGSCQVRVQACDGLAMVIENALIGSPNPDGETVQSLCERYVNALRPFAQESETTQVGIDVLVLGCTHYPFASDVLQTLAGTAVQLVEPGEPVAKQTRRLLLQHGLLRPEGADAPPGKLSLVATAATQRLQQAASQWLGLTSAVKQVHIA